MVHGTGTNHLVNLLNPSNREGSRVAIILFPKLRAANPLTEQVRYEKKLLKSFKNASSSIGTLISMAAKLRADAGAVPSAIKEVEKLFGAKTHHRITRNYATLFMFALKVNYFTFLMIGPQ